MCYRKAEELASHSEETIKELHRFMLEDLAKPVRFRSTIKRENDDDGVIDSHDGWVLMDEEDDTPITFFRPSKVIK